jgi:hypothetical protein
VLNHSSFATVLSHSSLLQCTRSLSHFVKLLSGVHEVACGSVGEAWGREVAHGVTWLGLTHVWGAGGRLTRSMVGPLGLGDGSINLGDKYRHHIYIYIYVGYILSIHSDVVEAAQTPQAHGR